MGRVFDLSSFRPPDQYLFLPSSCYHSLMNTSSIPLFSPNCSQPSAANRTCPHTPFWSQTPRSRLSTVDSRLFSNREPKSSQETLSPSKFATCNFLIGKNFNTARLPSPAPAFIPLPVSKKLELPLTRPKSTTSDFLIDSLGARILRRPPQLPSAEADRTSKLKPFTLSAAEGSHSAALSLASFASFASSPSCISNRPTPRLETPVSYRKQKMALISNRPQFVFSNFALRAPAAPKHAAAKAGPWPLSSLIANETHSREESSACKHTTCKILIANEFHGCGASFPAVEGHGTSEDSEA